MHIGKRRYYEIEGCRGYTRKTGQIVGDCSGLLAKLIVSGVKS